MSTLVTNLTQVSLHDINQVGGKAGSLGEMLQALDAQQVRIPQGFVITASAYRLVLHANNLENIIQKLLLQLTPTNDVSVIAEQIRDTILSASLPPELVQEIRTFYQYLCTYYHQTNVAVVVRSSATAEDLPNASFAGQQDSYLNVRGEDELLEAYRKTIASLFTDRAIVYRMQHSIPSESVAIAVCVQKMIRSDKASAGVIFTLDPESGFKNIVTINASYGLGEFVVKGVVTPDEFVVYKEALTGQDYPIIRHRLGEKKYALVISEQGTLEKKTVSGDKQLQFALEDHEIQELAQVSLRIEAYYSAQRGSWCPMDIEWAKDGDDGLLYIVQARPETIHGQESKQLILTRYRMIEPEQKRKVLVTGQSIGSIITQGTARIINNYHESESFKPGDILVTAMTDPDWVPLLRKAAAVVTNQGGRTCHAAIVSRELGIPAIIGTGNATELIAEGSTITIDCSGGTTGYVYSGTAAYTHETFKIDKTPPLPSSLLVNLGQPESAYSASQLPVAGVGLARLEFIIAQNIGIHPLAILHPEAIDDPAVIQQMHARAQPCGTLIKYFVEQLAEGIATIAAAFYPRPVIVRLTDLKSNEYKNLLGGTWFEPTEENPMIGWRGASRYITPEYTPAFKLECDALHKVRNILGFTNVHIMVPFVRTIQEAQKVTQLLQEYNLPRNINNLLYYMMVELPANVVLLEQFAPLFDGFSIGSNDLTQLTLGIDRDSSRLIQEFDERNPAVTHLIHEAILKAHAAGKHIGICGEAPSHYPDFARFLMQEGIDSLSLSADAILPFLASYQQ